MASSRCIGMSGDPGKDGAGRHEVMIASHQQIPEFFCLPEVGKNGANKMLSLEFLPNCCGGISFGASFRKIPQNCRIVVGFLELELPIPGTSSMISFLVGPYERVGGWVKWWCSQNPAAKTFLTSIFDVDNAENLVALGLSFKRVDNYNTTLPSWK